MNARPLSRRQALVLGGLGTAGVLVGGAGLLRGLTAEGDAGTSAGSDLLEPTMLASAGGVLAVELELAEREVAIAGRRARLLTYNGAVPGPTLRLRPGDRLTVHLVNNLAAPTNLHVHGLHVSPRDNGDNPFLMIEPGGEFDYEFALPVDHPTGTFWYHPHHHGTVADQVFAGLFGAIVVADDIAVTRERVLVISDISLAPDGTVRPPSVPERMMGREGDLLLVNGQLRPRLAARPGELERWRMINTCVARHLRLDLRELGAEVLGIDGDGRAGGASELVLAPGNRVDLLVQARAGSTAVRTLGVDRGGMGMMGGAAASGPATLATFVVAGDTVRSPAVPTVAGSPRDLRDVEPARRRTLAFTMGMGVGMGGGMTFGFNGEEFDPDRIDQEVEAGAVEEWTLINPTPMDHPFHLHVWPMQVIDGGAGGPVWRDVVRVPAGGTTVVRIAFGDFTGTTVYHCHILDHEDAGMMGTVHVAG